MRVLVQFTAEEGDLAPIVDIDHEFWADLPVVFVNAICLQAFWIKGFDHYSIESENGDPVVVAWNDDPAQWEGQRWGQRVRFPPLFSDPVFGGRLNTRIEIETFAEGAALDAWAAQGPTRPFDELDPPSGRGVLDGLQLSDARFYAHVAALPHVDFRDWA